MSKWGLTAPLRMQNRTQNLTPLRGPYAHQFATWEHVQVGLLFIMFSHCHDMKQRVENKQLSVHIEIYSRFQLWEKQRVVQRWVSSYHRRGQGFNLVCDCSQSTSHVNGLSSIQQISTCKVYYGSLYLQNAHTLARHWEFTYYYARATQWNALQHDPHISVG